MRHRFATPAHGPFIAYAAECIVMRNESRGTRLMGWVGQSYMAAQADAQIYLTNNNIPSGLRLEAVYSRQKYYENDKLFFQDNSPACYTQNGLSPGLDPSPSARGLTP